MKRGLTMVVGFVFVLAMSAGAFAQAPPAGQGRGDGQGRGGGGRGGGRGGPACTNLACDMQASWAQSAQQLTAIADAMPEDKWNFKPTDPQRTFGGQVMHIVQVDSKLLAALGGKTPAPQINMGAMSKADVMAALKQSMAYGDALIKEFDDQGLLERVSGTFLGPSASRIRVVSFSLGHSQDIYGQMAVYLRLNGVVPPASNRP
jgi:uncharacterized damage-inducible protein DinB